MSIIEILLKIALSGFISYLITWGLEICIRMLFEKFWILEDILNADLTTVFLWGTYIILFLKILKCMLS